VSGTVRWWVAATVAKYGVVAMVGDGVRLVQPHCRQTSPALRTRL